MSTITKLAEEYISKHASIKECLKKGLINYSALARLIQEEKNLKSKKEALLIASRRYKDKIKNTKSDETILELFTKSNITIKNSIVVFTLDKNIYTNSLLEIEKKVKEESDLFFAIEGTKTLTIITQKQYSELVKEKFKDSIILEKKDLSLITITSKGISYTPGAVSFISTQLYERNINIEEFISCYDDTLVVIDTKQVKDIMELLEF